MADIEEGLTSRHSNRLQIAIAEALKREGANKSAEDLARQKDQELGVEITDMVRAQVLLNSGNVETTAKHINTIPEATIDRSSPGVVKITVNAISESNRLPVFIETPFWEMATRLEAELGTSSPAIRVSADVARNDRMSVTITAKDTNTLITGINNSFDPTIPKISPEKYADKEEGRILS